MVCRVLGVARSNLDRLLARPINWQDGRKARSRDPQADLMLVDAVRAQIKTLPTYGYRRAGALLNRERCEAGLAPWNHKRVFV